MYVAILLDLVQLYVGGVSDRAILLASVMGNAFSHILPGLRQAPPQLRIGGYVHLDSRKTSSHQVAESQPGRGRN